MPTRYELAFLFMIGACELLICTKQLMDYRAYSQLDVRNRIFSGNRDHGRSTKQRKFPVNPLVSSFGMIYTYQKSCYTYLDSLCRKIAKDLG